MDQSSIQVLLREGIAAAKLAQQISTSSHSVTPDNRSHLSADALNPRERAITLLMRVLELDEENISAWIWLSTVLETQAEKQVCLENALILDPDNKHVRAGLARLQKTTPTSTAKATASPRSSRSPGRKYSRLKQNANARPQSAFINQKTTVRPAQPVRVKPDGPVCPFCEDAISTIEKSCPHCQLPLVMLCPDCGTAADIEQADCSACGEAMGDYRQPISYFSRLGAAYQEQGRYEAAIQAWQAVESFQPDYPQLQRHLGEAHLGMGRPDRAWASLERAMGQDPQSPEVRFALGELARQQGDREQAFQHYQTVIQYDSNHGLAWFQLGRLYQSVGRRKEATQAYQRAIKLLPLGSAQRDQAEAQLKDLNPGLPENLATGWHELIRQMTGPLALFILAALLDSGLRPWWIPLTGWLALILAVSGTFLCVSAGLPRNPIMQRLVGSPGLSPELKVSLAAVGVFLWVAGLALILLPLGQTFPEPPQL